MEELRSFQATPAFQTGRQFRAGVTTRLRPHPDWRRSADFLFVQVSFSLPPLLRWRETVDFDGPVYVGVMVLPSAPMARKLAADFPEMEVPQWWIDAVENDAAAGVDLACDLVHQVRDSGAFAGVHPISVSRYREVVARLEGKPR